MFPIILPNIDPVALQLGPLAIRWYSIAYIIGIVGAMFFLKKQNEKHKIMSAEAYDNWLIWAVLGIILGGRLGYVFFYNFGYYTQNPLEILWPFHDGQFVGLAGMSFHGGLCGAILAMWLFAKKYKINFLQLMDALL